MAMRLSTCDPELTAAYADSPLRDLAVEQPCSLRWSLPRGRAELVHRTTNAVQSSLLRSPGFCSLSCRCVERARGFPVVICYSRLGPFVACHKIAYPLLRSTGPSTQAFASELPRLLPQQDTQASRPHFDASAWCDRPGACSDNFGQKYLIGSYRGTSLVAWVLHGRDISCSPPGACLSPSNRAG